jgi:hypothetical protein
VHVHPEFKVFNLFRTPWRGFQPAETKDLNLDFFNRGWLKIKRRRRLTRSNRDVAVGELYEDTNYGEKKLQQGSYCTNLVVLTASFTVNPAT